MFETAGALIAGALISVCIANHYHRRASEELQKQCENLRGTTSVLEKYMSAAETTLAKINNVLADVQDDAAIARKYSAAGTPGDPDFPYK